MIQPKYCKARLVSQLIFKYINTTSNNLLAEIYNTKNMSVTN